MMKTLHKKINFDNHQDRFFVLLLLADSGFILLHIIRAFTGYRWSFMFSLEEDGGYSEIFQYIKEFWIVILLIYLAINYRKITYFFWSVLFVFFLLDDSIQIHESLGLALSESFNIPPVLGLRGRVVGELVGVALIGLFFLVILFVTYLRSERGTQKIVKTLFGLFALLVFFGVGVDTIHEIFRNLVDIRGAEFVAATLEDGGEMIVMSMFVWFLLKLPPLNPFFANPPMDPGGLAEQ